MRTRELMSFFQKQGGVVRFSAILKAGFHPDSLIALEKEGKVERIALGLYRVVDYEPGSHPDLVIASLQAPRGVICLLSALSFYEATSEIPKYVDIAIPQGTHANRIKYPPVKFYRFAPEVWKVGIEEYKLEGHKIRVYNLAKTIADCFKFRNRIGINTALEALKVAVTEKGTKPKEIMQYAKICRVDNIIKPRLEAML
ncbi:MAG: transcriptional regulator [bacterium (Candidatus Stahlbacteria) CG08_land_8_20_14_0_20_40_26]|nr:MAG: transcriptional regulator [bacterium (Candidatus Stahlbacteria) CG23_combo_of_CG06-09_8_20_14_all_40_9]PIS26360.1 MAG: transcriptional regulator [bacterium (Candidatus Stahlbacteria) CG08_land_8_20_14_0_20_40_26]